MSVHISIFISIYFLPTYLLEEDLTDLFSNCLINFNGRGIFIEDIFKNLSYDFIRLVMYVFVGVIY